VGVRLPDTTGSMPVRFSESAPAASLHEIGIAGEYHATKEPQQVGDDVLCDVVTETLMVYSSDLPENNVCKRNQFILSAPMDTMTATELGFNHG
jgi:hypothetical protein